MASPRQRRKVKRVMQEYKEGKLKSGGRRKVKNRRQAIAIAMSESGQSRNRRKKAANSRRKSGRRAAASGSTAQRRTRSPRRKKRSR